MQKSLSLILANTRKSEAYFDDLKKNNLPIEKIIFYSKIKNSKFLKKLDIYPYKNSIKFVKTNLVNSKIVEKEILKIKSTYILYSGYDAEIINNQNILKKNLIHCHPGLLPKYKGSTILYYSIIENNKIYVSVFKMSKIIDQGKVLFTSKFNLPPKIIDLEKDFDNSIRAKALILFLKSKKIQIKKQKSKYLNFYYIAHPIIRNIIRKPKSLLVSL